MGKSEPRCDRWLEEAMSLSCHLWHWARTLGLTSQRWRDGEETIVCSKRLRSPCQENIVKQQGVDMCKEIRVLDALTDMGYWGSVRAEDRNKRNTLSRVGEIADRLGCFGQTWLLFR